MPGSARAAKISKSQLRLREAVWPGLDASRLWNRKSKTGFATIPRSLPLICSILDGMSKGKPLSSTYFELWGRAYDESFVVLNKKEEQAFHAGFRGERAVSTWHERLRLLAKLGFLDIKPGPSGEISYALILNPYIVIREAFSKPGSGIPADAFNALTQRAIEIGADDLD